MSSSSSSPPPPPPSKPAEAAQISALWSDGRMRFLLELEFVEMLANPWYLQSLAQRKLLDDAAFVRYLDYLQYWRRPEYVRFISHPHALHFLELLQQPGFRGRLADHAFVELLHNNQFWHWKHFRANRFINGQPPETGGVETGS